MNPYASTLQILSLFPRTTECLDLPQPPAGGEVYVQSVRSLERKIRARIRAGTQLLLKSLEFGMGEGRVVWHIDLVHETGECTRGGRYWSWYYQCDVQKRGGECM